MITAIKPVYDRRTRRFDIEVVRDANVLLAHTGFLVFDDPVRALANVVAGRLIPRWSVTKRQAVINWLEAEAKAVVG